jgi:hypothetical protein
MDRMGLPEQGRALQEAVYADLERAFVASPDAVYQLRAPWLAPRTLAECHTVNRSLQSLTLAYGPWDTDQPHIHVTTWRDLPGQDFEPDVPVDLLDAPGEGVMVDIDGNATAATLVRRASTAWLLRADLGRVHVLASGRGPTGDLSFEPLADITSVIDARRRLLASRRPEA